MKPVYHTPDPAEAALIQGFLEENGIEAVLENDELLVGGQVAIDPSTTPTVMVPEADFERAEKLIRERADWVDDEEWGADEVDALDADEEE